MTNLNGNDSGTTHATGGDKSMTTAYLLWFFLGGFGVHRMYMGKMRSGLGMLGLFVATLVTTPFLIGFVGIPVIGLWWIADAFMINKWFKYNTAGAQAARPSATCDPMDSPMSNAA